MGQNSRRLSIWKWVLSVILIVLSLIIAAAVYLNFQWKPLLHARIKNAVVTSTNGLYTIQFDDIRTNILTGRISVKNIVFLPDSTIFNKMSGDSLAPRHLYKVEVNELILQRVHPWKIYFDGVLEMGSVVIDEPRLEVIFTNTKRSGPTTKPDIRTAWQRMRPYLKSLKVQDIIFQNANFQYIDHTMAPAKVTNLKGLTIKISDLLIDSASQFDKSRLYHTKDIYAELNTYRSLTADSNYTVQFQQFTASTSKRYAQVKGFRLIPRFGEMEFSKRFGFQKDRYSISVDDVKFNDIDFRLLNAQRRLLASALTLNNASASIFLNRSMPDSLHDRGSNFPQLSLQRFSLDAVIDTLIFNDSRVDYSEYNPETERKGTVSFTKINGRVHNITNDSARLSSNHFADAKLTALLMDRGRFNVNMRFDLTSTVGAFDFNGNIGRMDADMFNAAIRPLSLIEISSGQLNRMDFEGVGSTKGVKGNVACYYNGLKIALLEKSENTTWLKRRSLASIFANVLIIEGDNPSPGQAVRKVKFDYVRPAHSSFFNMIWKGMSSALLGSIGFDAETQREIKSRLRKMEVERFKREERRDERERRKVKRKSNRNARVP